MIITSKYDAANMYKFRYSYEAGLNTAFRIIEGVLKYKVLCAQIHLF